MDSETEDRTPDRAAPRSGGIGQPHAARPGSLERLLVRHGLDPRDAALVDRQILGGARSPAGWALRELNRIEFLRELGRPDGPTH